MLNCLFVGIGGFAGAICRYLMGMIPLQDKSGFPWITLCINAIGAFVIGLVTAAAAKNGWGDSHLVLFLKPESAEVLQRFLPLLWRALL